MFLSKSGGYYHSKDLKEWSLISETNLPVEEYAPTVVALGDTILFMTKNQKIYKSGNPSNGQWILANDSLHCKAMDPALFLDEDGRLYLYHGLSAREPIRGVELDRATLQPIGDEIGLIETHSDVYGWERPGDYNHGSSRRPWLEGAFMTKHDGKYFLEYSVPGTQFKSYADGMYVGENPLGPFALARNNPFSYKPEGFIAGAGHGSTFQDKYGNYWYAGTLTVAVINRLERRVGLFPAFFDNDNFFYTYTSFGDFPHKVPESQMKSYRDFLPSSMLLSYNKPVEASSTLNDNSPAKAVDENIQSCWSAQSGDKGEWFLVDLEDEKTIDALQINFADVDTRTLGRPDGICYQYVVETSTDRKSWTMILDKRNNTKDQPHDFIELRDVARARYIRITNCRVADGKFALTGFRVFGKGNGAPAKMVESFSAKRDTLDACSVTLGWKKSEGATGYNIRYGVAPDKLYLNYQVLGADTVTIYSLNSQSDYYFTVDVFNENGITEGKRVIKSATSPPQKKSSESKN